MIRGIGWRRVGSACVGTMMVAAAGLDAHAQGYPVKPVRLLVGFAPGGSTDIVARMLAQRVGELLGQTMIIENRPGAGGSLATERVAGAAADGYTISMISISETVLPALRKMPYDLQRDLAPVSLVTILPLVLVVHPSVPARDLRALIALAHLRPGVLNYGSSGVGSAAHLPGELFNALAGVKIVHVPFKGGGESVIGAASGQVDMAYASIPAIRPLIDAGRLRALAVTSAKRARALPSVPSFAEAGVVGYESSGWNGVVAPAALPKEILARLNNVIVKVLGAGELRELLSGQGLEPQPGTPEQFAEFPRAELAKNTKLIKATGASAL